VRFCAPSARILIVDDLATNLRVAEGLLSPYQARIDLATSGAMAVDLVRNNRYDIIFMDHMMPDMDGIEATAAIRAMEGTRFKEVPIIALTANAVSGMREVFLRHGFSDYLSKPVEISRLNEIMEKWTPREKREKADSGAKKQDVPPIGLAIEGVDMTQRLGLLPGSEALYREILALFCRDADQRLPFLREVPDAGALSLFVTHVHAFKSAAANIGAVVLSKKAACLEEAGQCGDIAAIQAGLDDFRQSLSRLLESIRAALERENPDEQRESSRPLDKETLLRLRDALRAEKIGATDRALAEAEAMRLDARQKEAMATLADCVLVSDFKEALRITDDLLGMFGRDDE
jgi:CheY-like chemotaxis protein